MKKDKNIFFFTRKILTGICIFSLLPSISSAEFLSDLGTIKGQEAEKEAETEKVQLPTPEIVEIYIEEGREIDEAHVIVRGKNFDAPNSTAEILFPNKYGTRVSGKIINRESTLLTATLPDNAGSGEVIVNLRGTKSNILSASSTPFFFEFQVPEILFVTAEEGFGSEKKIQIWGRNFDGISFRQNGKSLVDNARQGAALHGINSSETLRKFSVFETTLPAENFFQDFWVERNCNNNGEQCLISNKVSLSSAIPPVLTNWQADWSGRTITFFGKNFPDTDTKNISFTLEGKVLKLLEYNPVNNSAKASLPCPLPAWGELKMKLNAAKTTIESNPLLFEARSAPQILGIFLRSGKKAGEYDLVLESDSDIDIPDSPSCTDKNYKGNITLNSRNFSLQKQGGMWVSNGIPSGSIPSSGTAKIYFNGVASPDFPFSRADMEAEPIISRIESKYGFRPAGIFSVFGINLGNEYLACGSGQTSIVGPAIYYEDKTGYQCVRIAPEVTNTEIRAQFVGLESGQYFSDKDVSEVPISVKVGSKTSNKVTIPFNDPDIKVVEAPPRISRILYPNGHLPGNIIKIIGAGFGSSSKSNFVNFGSTSVLTETSRETQITVKIPEESKSETLTVTRRGNPDQVSESFPVSIAGGTTRELAFDFLPLDEDLSSHEIDVSSKAQTFTAAKIAVKNFTGDLSVRRFRVQIKWKDGEPESPLSANISKAFPTGSFSLSLNGKKISRPAVATFESGNAILDFHDFVLPLTTKEYDELKIEGLLLRTVTDGTQFSFSFSPQEGSDFLVYNSEAEKGELSTTTKTLFAPEKFIVKNAANTCLDLDDSNIHCAEYQEAFGISEPLDNQTRSPENTKINISSKTTTTAPKKSTATTKKTEIPEGILAATIRENFRDTDGDGLTDGEEILLGTNPQKTDTDGDGYSDFLEIEFGYNPKERMSQQLFSDLSGETAGSSLRLARMGILSGFSDGTFRSHERVSRGIFYKALTKMFGDGTKASESGYADIKRSHPFFDAIASAEKMKVLIPKDKEVFGAFEGIPRLEACESILRAAGYSLTETRRNESSFLDIRGTENPWAEKCIEFDIFSPLNADGTIFGTRAPVSRGELAEALLRGSRFFQEKK